MNYTKLIIPLIVLALIVAAYLFGLNTAPQKLSPFEKKEWKYKRTIDSLKTEYRKQVLRDSAQAVLIEDLKKKRNVLVSNLTKAKQEYESIHFEHLADSAVFRAIASLYPEGHYRLFLVTKAPD